MKLIYIILVSCVSYLCANSEKLNVLAILPYEGKSHFYVFQPYLRELAQRGHNVTVISHFPQKTTIENYHDISLAGSLKILESHFTMQRSYFAVFGMVPFLFGRGNENCRVLLENKKVQELWKSNIKFDVVAYEMFNSDCALGLAHQFHAPVVAITSHALLPMHYERFGIPSNPSYVPLIFFEGGFNPSLYQRVERTIFMYYFNLIYKYYAQRKDDKIIAEYFDNVPPVESLAKDIKCALVYHNFPLTGSRLFPANIIEVGGYHVAKPKPLPEDIRQFIDGAEDGVLYISFGTMVKASTLPPYQLQEMLKALAKIPQRIIWKWDNTSTAFQNSENMFLSPWLPQNDILAHPKIIAFYSHGGVLSTTEAIHYGVPLISMPVIGDQPSNAAAVEDSGLGVLLQIADLNENNLLKAIKKVTEPKFRENVKKLSQIWHDRPLSAMDTAIFWTEFTARNSNFTYRTKTVDISLYQYLCLDVLLVISLFIIILVLVLNYLCSKLVSRKKKKKIE